MASSHFTDFISEKNLKTAQGDSIRMRYNIRHLVTLSIATAVIGISGTIIWEQTDTPKGMFASIPFISNVYVERPQSSFFSLFFNVSVVSVCLSILVHWANNQRRLSGRRMRATNNVAMFFLGLASLGYAVVINFQEKPLITVHYLSAYGSFTCSSLALIVLSMVSHSLCPDGVSRFVSVLRWVISTASTSSILIMLLLLATKRDNILLSVSAFFEWIIFFMIFLFVGTLYPEFRAIDIEIHFNDS